ncbi:MAG: TIR domain-containing protein, partial [Caenispirillum sp.]|nr:TIR domain-containing protein [Caenispirillum sp.]
NCSSTQVADLAPLAGLADLRSLYCSSTQVRDLTPLMDLAELRDLYCGRTLVHNLAPLANLPLKHANLTNCTLTGLPHPWLARDDLHLVLYNATVQGLPAEVLSSNNGENCLPAIRAHFADLAAGAAPLPDAKVIVLGNGGVGKTQLCRRLRGEPFQDHWDSTHGIRISTADIPGPDDASLPLTLWDFGGQEIYHGTHALFMRTDALFLVLWAPDHETGGLTDAHGLTFRNHPLQYWADYVRHTTGSKSPTILGQTRCDSYADEVRRAPVTEETLDALSLAREMRVSARTGHGMAELVSALQAGVAWLRETRGEVQIGLGRLAVRRRIEALPADRKLLDKAEFRRWCAEAGGVSNPDLLLQYFHNSGLVFYRPGLFHDRIVLDHAWALNGIYILFDRTQCFTEIRRGGGRFTRPLLEALAWREAGYSVEEQRLFLSMMQTAGMCFVHRRAVDPDDTEYIAPELLPDKAAVRVELADRWSDAAPEAELRFEYPLLHPGIIRGIISRVGSQAGLAATYWRTGVYVFEETTGGKALIEEVRQDEDAHHGVIRLATRGDLDGRLLNRLREWVEEVNAGLGLKPDPVHVASATMRPTSAWKHTTERARSAPPEAAGPEETAPELRFAEEQADTYVSYAWAKGRPLEAEFVAKVDELIDKAKAQGITIQRDKDALRPGERISMFMENLGQGRRVFVILSDAYLRSADCTFELFEIWRTSGRNGEDFLKRVRVYVHPTVDISTPLKRKEYFDYWRDETRNMEELINETGWRYFAPEERQRHEAACGFADDVMKILFFVADTLQPGSWEEFLEYGLDDRPAP